MLGAGCLVIEAVTGCRILNALLG